MLAKNYSILYYFIRFYTERQAIFALGSVILIIVAGFSMLSRYLISDFNLYFGLLMFPMIIYVKDKNIYSLRYGFYSLVMLVLYYFVPVLTIYYFAFCFALIFIVENLFGKINNAILVLIFILGSITRYFVNIFSFSIRLELSALSGKLLNFIGYENTVSGNIISHAGSSFSVDPECIGLKMVVTGFLMMLLFTSIFERRNRQVLSIYGIIFQVIITIILIMISNLARIIALILFRSEPGTFSHEIIGIFSIFLYTIVPLYFITPFVITFLGKKMKRSNRFSKDNRKYVPLLILPITIALIYYNIVYQPNSIANIDINTANYQAYNIEIAEHNVTKLYNDNALIYIKPPTQFYGSDHNPYICWKGSGYMFENINIETIDNMKVYTALLVNGTDKLYTSWWYDNGDYQTIDQWDWRWRTIKGENAFRLINVSCENRKDLENEIRKMKNMQ